MRKSRAALAESIVVNDDDVAMNRKHDVTQ